MTLWRSDCGLVTAEFALVIPSFAVLLLALGGSFQLCMEMLNNLQLAQTEAVKVGLGGESDYSQQRLEGVVCVSVPSGLEILDGYACAVDYRFSRLSLRDDAGLEFFGN